MKWNTKLAGLTAALSFGAEVEQTVQFINLIPLFHLLLPDCWAVHCLLCLLTSSCTVWTPGPLALCSFFFFFLLGCLVLTANLLLTFALPRRSSPLNFSFNPPALAWVSSLESNRCSAEASLEQKCALCAGRAVLSCMSSSSLPLLESSNVFRWTESTLTSSPSQL